MKMFSIFGSKVWITLDFEQFLEKSWKPSKKCLGWTFKKSSNLNKKHRLPWSLNAETDRFNEPAFRFLASTRGMIPGGAGPLCSWSGSQADDWRILLKEGRDRINEEKTTKTTGQCKQVHTVVIIIGSVHCSWNADFVSSGKSFECNILTTGSTAVQVWRIQSESSCLQVEKICFFARGAVSGSLWEARWRPDHSGFSSG